MYIYMCLLYMMQNVSVQQTNSAQNIEAVISNMCCVRSQFLLKYITTHIILNFIYLILLNIFNGQRHKFSIVSADPA